MKIVAVASVGGHWIQLLRLQPLFEQHETVFVSTRPDFKNMVAQKFYSISDFNRDNMKGLFKAIGAIRKILKTEQPDVVITTGAAPGLLVLLLARLRGVRTIWLDSIANVEELSMSGKIAAKFCSRVYTQWPDLASGKIIYAGNVLK
ncbi:MAG: oligosaccharide biosynthesis protein Alg14 [Chitinophagaceae bacterium]|nr:MAG: oligosaccharide biosynthesis protein Alg14 [Chitinophagaceae bacterium]